MKQILRFLQVVVVVILVQSCADKKPLATKAAPATAMSKQYKLAKGTVVVDTLSTKPRVLSTDNKKSVKRNQQKKEIDEINLLSVEKIQKQ